MCRVILISTVSVLGSLMVVWLLSQAVGFHYNPSVVAALSGTLSALIVAKKHRNTIAQKQD